MAKKWSEVEQSPEYQALPDSDKAAARDQYFNSVVVPQLPPEEVAPARAQFTAQVTAHPNAQKDREKSVLDKVLSSGSGMSDNPDLSLSEQIVGTPLARAAIGAAGVITGPAQLGAHIGDAALNYARSHFDWIKQHTDEPVVGKYIDEKLAELDAMKEKSLKGGTDWMGMLGQATAGGVAAKSLGVAGAVLPAMKDATTAVGKLAQGAGIGAGLTAAAPDTSGGDKYFDAKGHEIAVGAGIGALAQPVLNGIAYVSKYPYHLVERFLPGGKEAIQGRTLNTAAGASAPEVVKSLEAAKPLVAGSEPTAGEAVADVNAPAFAALQEKVTGRTPDTAIAYRARKLEQEAARAKNLEVPPSAIVAEARDSVTGPMRETALSSANESSTKAMDLSEKVGQKIDSANSATQERWKLLTDAAQQKNLSNTQYYNVPGLARKMVVIQPRFTMNAKRVPENLEAAKVFENVAAQRKAEQGLLQYQLDSLEAHGQRPLAAGGIVSRIDSVLAQPAFAASNKAPILAAVRDKINALKDENGIINSDALYTVRKELNETIETLLGGTNVQGSKKRAAELASQIKPMIDNAIDSAAGDKLWSQYIKTHTELSRKVDQSRIMEYLSDKLAAPLEGGNERANVFANAMRDAAQEGTLKKTTGFGGYDKLDQVLTPAQMHSVNAVKADLEKQAKYAAQAREGSKAITKQLREMETDIELPNLLNKSITLANAVIRRLEGGGGEKTLDELSKIMLDPKKTAALMREATDKERRALAQIARLKGKQFTGEVIGSTQDARTRRKAERAAGLGKGE